MAPSGSAAEETDNFFASFDQQFPPSPFGETKVLPDVSGHIQAPFGTTLLTEVSGHNTLIEQKPPEKLQSIPASPQRSVVSQLSAKWNEEKTMSPKKWEKPFGSVDLSIDFADTNACILERTPDQSEPLSIEVTDHPETERDDEEDKSEPPSLEATDDDELLQVATTTDGTAYLELSMEFLEVNLPEEPAPEKISRRSSICSVLSSATVARKRKEKRRGKRRDHQKIVSIAKESTLDTGGDGSSSPEKTKDEEKSPKTSPSKEKHKKKHRHRTKNVPAADSEEIRASKEAVSSASVQIQACLDSATTESVEMLAEPESPRPSGRAPPSPKRLSPSKLKESINSLDSPQSPRKSPNSPMRDKYWSPSKLGDSTISMGSPRRPRKSPASPRKDYWSPSKLGDSCNSMGSKNLKKKRKRAGQSKRNIPPGSKEQPSSFAAVSDLPLPDLDTILTTDAELALVGDVWMDSPVRSMERKNVLNSPQRVKLIGETNVRTIKLAESMPGDYENGLLDKHKDTKEPERSLFDILNIDPWDREGSVYSDNEAVAAMQRDESVCATKYNFEAFENKLYPLFMLCAIGASLEAVQTCFEKYPAALDERDHTGSSPLHYASSYAGDVDIMEWLMAKKPSQLDEVDVLKRSPFHVACLYNARVTTLKVLISKSPNGLAALDYEGNTTLHVATEQDAPLEVIDLLIKKYPDALLTKRSDGSTPLHVALAAGAETGTIKMLMKAKPEALGIANDTGKLPLHASLEAAAVNPKTVKLVVKGYPNALKAINRERETPLAVAKRLGLGKNIVSLLKS